MIILALRLPWALVRGVRRSKIDLLAPSTMRMRVLPNDLDLYMHINNGRYLSLMDLGRTEWSARSGMWSVFRRRNWKPVAGATAIRFRRSLQPFQRYTLTTRLLGWSGKWCFFEQRFERGDQLCAIGYAKVAVLKGSSTLPADEVLAEYGWTGDAPELPQSVLDWQKSDAS